MPSVNKTLAYLCYPSRRVAVPVKRLKGENHYDESR
jgi:hypothetical protein